MTRSSTIVSLALASLVLFAYCGVTAEPERSPPRDSSSGSSTHRDPSSLPESSITIRSPTRQPTTSGSDSRIRIVAAEDGGALADAYIVECDEGAYWVPARDDARD